MHMCTCTHKDARAHLEHRVPQIVAHDVRPRHAQAPPQQLLDIRLRVHREGGGQRRRLVRVPVAPQVPQQEVVLPQEGRGQEGEEAGKVVGAGGEAVQEGDPFDRGGAWLVVVAWRRLLQRG